MKGMTVPIPKWGKIAQQLENALLSGVTLDELLDSDFNPGSVMFAYHSLRTSGRISKVPGWVGKYNRARRKSILKRDGYKCRKCGVSGPDVELELHHRDHNRKNNKTSNLITWCKDCNFVDGQEYAKELRVRKQVDNDVTNGLQQEKETTGSFRGVAELPGQLLKFLK